MDNNKRKDLAECIMTVMPALMSGMISRRAPRAGPWHLHLLFKLRDNPGIIMSALSKELNMPRPNLTVAVDKLVKEGLIEREFSEHDRRIVSLRLTRHGVEQVEVRRRMMIEDTTEALARLSDEDAESLARHMRGIAEIIKKYSNNED